MLVISASQPWSCQVFFSGQYLVKYALRDKLHFSFFPFFYLPFSFLPIHNEVRRVNQLAWKHYTTAVSHDKVETKELLDKPQYHTQPTLSNPCLNTISSEEVCIPL